MATSDKDNDFLDYNLPQNAYVAFDAVSLKDYIVNRLNNNEKFIINNFRLSPKLKVEYFLHKKN